MANVVVTMSGDEAKLWKAQQRIFDQQAKINAKMREGEQASKSAASTATASATKIAESNESVVDSIKDMATQYLSLQGGMTLLNGLAAEYDRLQQASLEKTKAIAAAQQETIKNLQGMSFIQKEELLTKAVDQIQKETGFAGRDQITLALGSAISAGATVEEAISAVKAAAKLNTLNAEGMKVAAAGAVDIGRQTGISDAEKSLGFLLNLGAVSRVEDPRALNQLTGEFLGNTIATMSGVETDQAARQAGALFATLNQMSNDVTGRSSSTATIQFASYMRQFFTDQGARDPQAAKREKDIAKLEEKAAVTDREKLNIKIAEENLRKATDEFAKASASPAETERQIADLRKLELKREDARLDLEKANKSAGLTDSEAKELAALKAERDSFASITDPGTLEGRMRALQENEKLRAAFLDKMPGEQAFKIPFEKLVTAGSDAFAMFQENIPKLAFDEKAFQEAAEQAQSMTPQLSIANAEVQSQAAIEQFDITPEAAAKGAIAKIANETLPRVRSGGIPGMVQFAVENIAGPIRKGMGGDAQGFADYTIEQLEGRRAVLERGGIDPNEKERFDLINMQIEAIRKIIERLDQETAKASLEKSAKHLEAAAAKQQSNAARAQAARAN